MIINTENSIKEPFLLNINDYDPEQECNYDIAYKHGLANRITNIKKRLDYGKSINKAFDI